MKDLFGVDVPLKEVSLSVYCDERIIDMKTHPNRENWTYIALLLIPAHEKSGVLDTLNRHRENKDIRYFGELKFSKLRKGSRNSRITRLAKLWLQEIINDTGKRLYFRILGIKMDNLLYELFGNGDTSKGKYGNIYNRFFRMTFLGAVNTYWPQENYQEVVVSSIFHDKQGRLEAHRFFPWHLVYKVSGDRIFFKSDQIIFVESDHNTEPKYKDDSHFVQLADVLIGSASHCLDFPTKYNEGKNEVARVVLPFLKDILKNQAHFRRCDVCFYPSKKLTIQEFYDDDKRSQSQFFRERSILLEEHLFGKQLSFSFKGM